jgi:RNA polymerase sigma-70 factor (ECF subfamily)
VPKLERLTEDLDLAEIRSVLSRAVSRVCPPWLSDRKDDLVQAAVMRVMDLWNRREGNQTFTSSYLYRVAYSALVDEIRRVRRRREVALEADPEEDGPPREIAAASEDPERRAMSREVGRGIQSCLEKLLPERRQAVALHLLGHSVQDTARILDYPFKRAENLVYRGLADLRACLDEKGLKP